MVDGLQLEQRNLDMRFGDRSIWLMSLGDLLDAMIQQEDLNRTAYSALHNLALIDHLPNSVQREVLKCYRRSIAQRYDLRQLRIKCRNEGWLKT